MRIFKKPLVFLLLIGLLLSINVFKASARLIVISPNGGECLTVGIPYTIQAEFNEDHAALYYRTDGRRPTHLDASRIKFPLTSNTFVWTPEERHISENGKIWVEDLNEANETKGWDSSAFDFSVRPTCPTEYEENPTLNSLEAELREWRFLLSRVESSEQKIQRLISLDEENLLQILSEIYEVKNQVNELLPVSQRLRTELNLITKSLTAGMEDEEVKILEKILSKFPEIYKESEVDGNFSTSTEEALKQFQIIFDLPEEEYGTVQAQTKFRLNTLIDSTVHVITKDSEGRFNPAELFVAPGDVVRWFNNSAEASWPASGNHPTHGKYPEVGGCINSLFDACRPISTGESYYFVFNVNGEWDYHDHLNPDLKGKIIVK